MKQVNLDLIKKQLKYRPRVLPRCNLHILARRASDSRAHKRAAHLVQRIYSYRAAVCSGRMQNVLYDTTCQEPVTPARNMSSDHKRLLDV